MNGLKLALQNSMRRKLRTLVTLSGVAIAVAAMYSLLAFERGYQAGMQSELDRLGAHILVTPKGCPYDAASIALHGASWPCYLKADYVTGVARTEGVDIAAPLLMNAVIDPQTGAQSVYVGADATLLRLKRGWHIDGAFPRQGADCLVGANLAQSMHLRLGQRFTLPAMKGAQGRVCGILASTQGPDDGFFYLPLATAQALFKRPHQITHILVRLSDPDKMDLVVGLLRGCGAGLQMNVVPLTYLFRSIQGMISSTRLLLGCFLLVALLVAGAGVSNTLLMAVTERTREIGVLRAVGAARADIFQLIWLEAALVCLAGGLVGVIGATLGAHQIEAWLRSRLAFSPIGSLVHFEPIVVLLCLTGAMLLGSLAGLLPAWRASRLSPVEAIREGARV